MNARVLQRGVLPILDRLVTGLDESVALEDEERQKHAGHVCATEILVEKGATMAESIHDFLMEHGYVCPSSVVDSLREAHRAFLQAAAFAEGGLCTPSASADLFAHKAHEHLHDALRRMRARCGEE